MALQQVGPSGQGAHVTAALQYQVALLNLHVTAIREFGSGRRGEGVEILAEGLT